MNKLRNRSIKCQPHLCFKRYQDNSPTNQLAVSQVSDWSTCRLVNSLKYLI